MTIEELDAQVKKLLEEGAPRIDFDDVVIVTRCKDCKFFMKGENINGRGWCSFSQHGCPMPDDYCSDAERKEE